jgi:hypothetical protein
MKALWIVFGVAAVIASAYTILAQYRLSGPPLRVPITLNQTTVAGSALVSDRAIGTWTPDEQLTTKSGNTYGWDNLENVHEDSAGRDGFDEGAKDHQWLAAFDVIYVY